MWNAQLESRLVELKSQGLSFGKIAKEIGVSRNAAKGKYHRIFSIFPHQIVEREAVKKRRDARNRRNVREVEEVTQDIAKRGRDAAIMAARAKKFTLRNIGLAAGVSFQRVHQIVLGRTK